MSRHYCTVISILILSLLPVGYAQDVVKQVVPFEGAERNLLWADRFRPVDSNGSLSLYPFTAVAGEQQGGICLYRLNRDTLFIFQE